jgi:peptidoglycan/LPS O-acetylase OafA/YrhL
LDSLAFVRPVGTYKMTARHYPWLDWLRFAAAFSVVVTHARVGHWVGWNELQAADRHGATAGFFALAGLDFEPVVVFFVLSGFLVGGKMIERLGAGDFQVGSYALDRFSRIYIPLVPALGLSAFAAWLAGRSISLAELAGNLASLQEVLVPPFAGNGPLWSLSYEVWFYIIAGAAASACVLPGAAAAVAFLILLTGFFVFTRLDPILLICWFLGAVAFPLRRQQIGWRALLPGLFLVAAGVLASQLAVRNLPLTSTMEGWVPSRGLALLMMSGGLAIVLAWLSALPVTGGLMIWVGRVGASLAAFAYTLYLTHYPVLQIWSFYGPAKSESVDGPALAVFVAKVVSCLLMAWILYLPFESRTAEFRQWARRRIAAGV